MIRIILTCPLREDIYYFFLLGGGGGGGGGVEIHPHVHSLVRYCFNQKMRDSFL